MIPLELKKTRCDPAWAEVRLQAKGDRWAAGADRAYYRMHHFARLLASLFPLLAVVGAWIRCIEIGTGVIACGMRTPSTWWRRPERLH